MILRVRTIKRLMNASVPQYIRIPQARLTGRYWRGYGVSRPMERLSVLQRGVWW